MIANHAYSAANPATIAPSNVQPPKHSAAISLPSNTELFNHKVRLLIESGALDEVLEERLDVIQERKNKARLAKKWEQKQAEEAARLRAIKDNMPSPDVAVEPFLGNKNAPFSLIEYSDFGCPYCKKFHKTGYAFIKKYGKHANWIYRNLPLSMHEPYGSELAIGGLCLKKLGGNELFWSFTEATFNSPDAKSGKIYVDNFALSNGIFTQELTQYVANNQQSYAHKLPFFIARRMPIFRQSWSQAGEQ